MCVCLGLTLSHGRLPRYACQFIEMCLMVTADHGPAVSGAHNTIVCARAGKDLVSSLTSGLLTIVCHAQHTHTTLFHCAALPHAAFVGVVIGGASFCNHIRRK